MVVTLPAVWPAAHRHVNAHPLSFHPADSLQISQRKRPITCKDFRNKDVCIFMFCLYKMRQLSHGIITNSLCELVCSMIHSQWAIY